MGIFTKIKRAYRKPMLFGAFAGLLLFSLAFFFANRAQGVSFPGVKQDCDNNAVIYCGALDSSKVASGDYGYNHKSSVRDIYEKFGISKADVDALGKTAVAGKVTKNGDVLIGNTVVATNAITAGRQYIPGSGNLITYKTAKFYERSPKVSFASNSLDAYVVMTNGKFDYAIIAACGNPVKGTPKLPDYTIAKEVQVKGTSAWSKSVNVKPGTHVNYRVTVASTGQIPVYNLTVSDKLPANDTYVSGTFARDGKKVSGDTSYFGNGLNIGTLNNGTKTVFTYEAVIGASDTVDNCTEQTLVNIAKEIASSLPAKQDTATVVKACEPKKPAYSVAKEVQKKGDSKWYKSITVDPGTKVTYRITYSNDGNTTLNGVLATDKLPKNVTYVPGTLKFDEENYDSEAQYFFGGGIPMQLSQNGYIEVTFDAVIGEKDTSMSCTNEVLDNFGVISKTGLPTKEDKATVNKQCAPKPQYVCKSLTAKQNGDRTSFTFVTFAALENVVLKNVKYTVKDASGAVVETIPANDLNPVDYTQTKEGTYKVSVAITVTVDGKDAVASGTCEDTFTVSPPPVTPVYLCNKFKGQGIVGKKNTAQYTLSYTATGGAKLTGVNIAWGDGKTGPVDLNKLDNFTYTYSKPGTYTAVATLNFTINDKTDDVKSVTCETAVTVTQPMCTVPGKEQYPADDTVNCVTPTPTPTPTPPAPVPTKLVNTGPGDVAGMFAAVTVAGTVAYRLVWLRRFNG